MRKRRDRKRRDQRADPSTDEDASRRDEEANPDDDPLATRLDSVSSRFSRPPTSEELRSAFARKPGTEQPRQQQPKDFTSSYPAETLFVPTIDEPVEIPSEIEDRSRTRGDYYYDPDDAWAVLGVRPGADWHEIAAAHRKLAMVHHPDRLLHSSAEVREASEAAMRDINVAYSVLRRMTGN